MLVPASQRSIEQPQLCHLKNKFCWFGTHLATQDDTHPSQNDQPADPRLPTLPSKTNPFSWFGTAVVNNDSPDDDQRALCEHVDPPDFDVFAFRARMYVPPESQRAQEPTLGPETEDGLFQAYYQQQMDLGERDAREEGVRARDSLR